MRALLVLALLAGCARPGTKRFSSQLASVGGRLVAIVKSGAIKVDVKQAVTAAGQTPPSQRVKEAPPPAQQAQPQPQTQPQQPGPAPDVKVTRIDASRATVFVMHGETRGGKAFCETHTTIEACTSSCTALLRSHSMQKPDDTTPNGCVCDERDRGC